MDTPHPGDALHRLLHAYKRALRDAYRSAGIELPITHVRVLKGIHHGTGATVQSIARRMHRDKAQITRVVKELRGAGLAQSRVDPDDARSRLLTATAGGTRLLRRVARAERDAGARMADGLSEQALARFVSVADAMAANLDCSEDTP